jgi:class 3 adenylate cyclase/tetratricopeptide (TPR) repeat protein
LRVDDGAPITVLFTDVEGSTDLRTRRGDDAAHGILRAHEGLVRGCVAEHGGREIKALGDGFMIAFTSARKALTCAIAIQQATEAQRQATPERAVRVRIGVNTGEVVAEDDDLYGQAVNAAARIAGRAQAGEILVAEVTKQLVGSNPSFPFVDRGRLRLKGFPERWRLFGLPWERADTTGSAGLGDGRLPYVGREAERAELRRLLDAAARGSGALVMVGGEPGVGKTRLAEELMTEAADRDMQVFAGHSYEAEGAAPFIAVVEIFEAALAAAPSAAAFRAFLGEEAAEVTRLVPRLRQLCPDIPPPLELPAEQERRLLFNCVAEVVARSARSRPMLLVFDDLHWADDPTLLLVEHLAAAIADLPVLMLTTYRDTEVDVGRPLAKTFEDLRKRRLARWITLGRLPESDVAQVLARVSGRDPPAALVRAIYEETEGNPFFLGEVYRYLVDEGRLFDPQGRFRRDLAIGELDVPDTVRLVVGRRLERLGDGVKRVLTQAGIVGRAFSVEVLEAMEGSDPDALLDVIETAERARLIIPAPDPSGEDRFIFAHELIRQTLLADLSLTRRRRLHARTADALERHSAAQLDQQAATIAYHLLEAETAGDAGRAFAYLVRAGRWAMDGGAFEEALRHHEKALTFLEVAAPAARAALLADLGDARRCAGHWDTAIDAWRRSADVYHEVGDAEGAGRVCEAAAYNLVWAGRFVEGVEIAERGLSALGDRVSPTRARLLGTAAFNAAAAGLYDVSAGMTDRALALARQLDDDALLGHILAHKAMAHWCYLEHRAAVDAGLPAADLLRATGDPWGLSVVLGFLLVSLTSQGRFDEALAMDEELTPLAERIGNHGALMQHRRMTGLIGFFRSGDIDRLEAFAQEDRRFCEAAGLPWVASDWSWLGWAQFLRGDWDEARSLFRRAVDIEPPGGFSGWNASMLLECLAYRGEKAEALAVLEGRILPGPGEPKLWGPVSMLLSAVEGFTVLGERERAADLYPAVVDVFDRTRVVCPAYDDGRLVLRAAAIAAAAGQRWAEAEEHFEAALHQAVELPHRLEEAHTRRWYGRMLLDRGGPGDQAEAENVLTQAVADYERMRMPRHRDLAAQMLNR